MFVSVQRLARETSEIVAEYRREIEDSGVSPAEASALARGLEARLLRPLVHGPAAEVRPAPWADVEAFFVAVVRLQLALGNAPDASAAVDYMSRSGLLLPDISPRDARCLAERVPIRSTAIYSAFRLGRLLEDGPQGGRGHGGRQ